MKVFLVLITTLFFISVTSACEVKSLEKVTAETSAKLSKVDIRAIPCDSLQTALAAYGKKFTSGGRRLEPVETKSLSNQDVHKNICSDPLWSKKIMDANSISDTDIRIIVTAAILDEAEEYVARDMVLNNAKVKPCTKNQH